MIKTEEVVDSYFIEVTEQVFYIFFADGILAVYLNTDFFNIMIQTIINQKLGTVKTVFSFSYIMVKTDEIGNAVFFYKMYKFVIIINSLIVVWCRLQIVKIKVGKIYLSASFKDNG